MPFGGISSSKQTIRAKVENSDCSTSGASEPAWPKDGTTSYLAKHLRDKHTNLLKELDDINRYTTTELVPSPHTQSVSMKTYPAACE